MSDDITRESMIGEVVRRHPESARVMLSYGLHCVGCRIGSFETIEQGCRGHGMPEEMIDEMVAELQEIHNREEE